MDEQIEIRSARNPGWFWMDNDVLDQFGPTLGPYGLTVYIALARHAGSMQIAYPSLHHLAEETGMSRREVIRRIDQLCELKLIKKTARQSDYGGTASNLYTLLSCPKREGPAPGGVPGSHQGSDSAAPGAVPDRHQGSDSQAHKEDSEKKTQLEEHTHTEKKAAPPGAECMISYPAPFLEFWNAYPKKIKKDAALKIWQRLKLTAFLPLILTKLAQQKTLEAWTRDQGRYIPNPATYLSEGRWKDENTPLPSKASQTENEEDRAYRRWFATEVAKQQARKKQPAVAIPILPPDPRRKLDLEQHQQKVRAQAAAVLAQGAAQAQTASLGGLP